MDELAKAFEAAHLAFDVLDDELEIRKLKKAEKLARQVHAKVLTPSHPVHSLAPSHSSSSSDAGHDA